MKRAVIGVLVLGSVLLSPGCRHGDSPGCLTWFSAERLERIERQRLSAQATSRREDYTPRADWFRLTSAPELDSMAAAPHYRLAGYGGQQQEPDAEGKQYAEAGLGQHSRPGPLPSFGDTLKRDLREMPADVWEDTKAVYTSRPNLLILGLTYGGSLALQETGPDDTVEDSFTRHGHRTFKDDWRDAFGAAGNPGTHFALASLWYLVGQQRQDDKTYQVGKTLFSALMINGLSTMVGKAATWDDTPNGEWGAFPSGHTSSSFTFASVMHQAYGHWVGIPLYALSGLAAYERLESGEHYLADVVMGGVMGLVIGHTVAGEHEFRLFGGEIVPHVDPYTNTSGIAWVKHFK